MRNQPSLYIDTLTRDLSSSAPNSNSSPASLGSFRSSKSADTLSPMDAYRYGHRSAGPGGFTSPCLHILAPTPPNSPLSACPAAATTTADEGHGFMIVAVSSADDQMLKQQQQPCMQIVSNGDDFIQTSTKQQQQQSQENRYEDDGNRVVGAGEDGMPEIMVKKLRKRDRRMSVTDTLRQVLDKCRAKHSK